MTVESIGEVWSKYKELGGLDDIDYPKNEQVFSWNRDSPFIRPETYRCANCNHSFIGRERCDGRKCEKCGYPIKLYGYPDLVHDTFFDMNEVPYDFSENGYYNLGAHTEFREVDQNVPIITGSVENETETGTETGTKTGTKTGAESIGLLKPEPNQNEELYEQSSTNQALINQMLYGNPMHNELLHKRVVHNKLVHDKLMHDQMSSVDVSADKPKDIPIYRSDSTQGVTMSNHVDKKIEHMKADADYIYGFFATRFCLFIIAVLVAHLRGELKKPGTDETNWSLIVCVFFFPDFYFAYAIFEWVLRPICQH